MSSPSHPLNPSLAESLAATFGALPHDPAAPGNGLALFLLGLITGVAIAVAISFFYLHRSKSTRQLSHLDPRDPIPLDNDFEEPADPPRSQPSKREPWERPDDWWRKEN